VKLGTPSGDGGWRGARVRRAASRVLEEGGGGSSPPPPPGVVGAPRSSGCQLALARYPVAPQAQIGHTPSGRRRAMVATNGEDVVLPS